MEWSDETVIEFLKLLASEPPIWNPKHKDNKNRLVITEAWQRIQKKFSYPCSVVDLKRKRNILLTQYRQCLRRIKEAVATDGVYRPSWFAFDVMHHYLGAVYDRPPRRAKFKPEIEFLVTEHEPEGLSPSHSTLNSHESDIGEAEDLILVEGSESPISEADSFAYKRRRGIQDVLITSNEMPEPYTVLKTAPTPPRQEPERRAPAEDDECELYGQLLAKKIKTLGTDDRLTLMNDIDNLVFQYIMKVRKQNVQNTVPEKPIKCGPEDLTFSSKD